MASHKKLASLVFLLALAGSIVAWSYGPFPAARPVPVIPSTPLQQPLDTSAWKTYRNEELGFAIQLPPRWEADYTIEVKTWERNGYLKSVSFSHKVETGINPYTKERIIEDYKIFAIAMVTKEWWEKKLSYEEPQPGFLGKNNDRVYIYISGHDIDQREHEEIKQVVKSFEVNQPLDTSEWKTYRNEELGFAIQLPPRWEGYKITTEGKLNESALGIVSFSKEVVGIDNLSTGEIISRDYRIFSVSLVTKNWWEKKLSYEEPRPGFLYAKNEVVYLYHIGHDTETLEREEIRALLSTFEVIE